ncbi:protein of unknown function DUF92 transmembrane [Methanothermus fervidus DSM 2088]|uniref:DUF92 domain-containing protein n=1 Tax=Methanothermus fervidus (strain ATCC 43054 / DSM 2088 / JCM 10308 / V24 S) TaxID=523846 RepID=E3GXA3_METFV|nr:protein of unknown function DUF92 transmembrane [Methanothermus fervidus DSM 2088]
MWDIFFCISIGIITYIRKDLDLAGSVLMVVLGLLILFAAGFNWLLILFIFLILGIISTKYQKEYKKKLGIYEKKRSMKNVLSNGIVPVAMAILGRYDRFVGGFIGSIAAATADTMASEIGIIQKPRLITNLKKVPPGTDGGVSILGTVIGIVGAAIIGISAYFLNVCPNILLSLKVAIISGIIGSFTDSFLGATFERKNF